MHERQMWDNLVFTNLLFEDDGDGMRSKTTKNCFWSLALLLVYKLRVDFNRNKTRNIDGISSMSAKICNFAYSIKPTINQWLRLQFKIPI